MENCSEIICVACYFFSSGKNVKGEEKKQEKKQPNIPLIETGIAPSLGWV